MFTLKKTKKYSYLLLELLVGLTLLTLSLAPLLQSPQQTYIQQKKEISKIYFQWEKEKILCDLEQKLRSGDISWEQLLKSKEQRFLVYKEYSKESKKPLDSRVYCSKQNNFVKDRNGDWLGKVVFTGYLYFPGEKKYTEKFHASFFVSKKNITKASHEL